LYQDVTLVRKYFVSIYNYTCIKILVLFYLLVLIFVALILIGGYDATMRLVAYIDLNVRYSFIKLRSYFLMRKLRSQLVKDNKQLLKEQKKNV
tara:strand:+ start:215 stop:493 length:279 start_codon:yes stop_codon:yes gene_type:complete